MTAFLKFRTILINLTTKCRSTVLLLITGNKYLMFYNGNNFGEKGDGLAEIDKNDLTI